MNQERKAYRLEVLEQLASGRRSVAWAKWRLKHGSFLRKLTRRLPALFLAVDVRSHEGPRIFIPLLLLPLGLLGIIGLPIAQLVLRLCKKRPLPFVWEGMALLWRMMLVGRGPIVWVESREGDRVKIALW